MTQAQYGAPRWALVSNMRNVLSDGIVVSLSRYRALDLGAYTLLSCVLGTLGLDRHAEKLQTCVPDVCMSNAIPNMNAFVQEGDPAENSTQTLSETI
jgi:hypothetical protein